jgi:hypothetical protein
MTTGDIRIFLSICPRARFLTKNKHSIKCGNLLDENTNDMNITILLVSYSVKILSYNSENLNFNTSQLIFIQNVIQSIDKIVVAVLDETLYINILLYTQQQELLVEMQTLFYQVEGSLESLVNNLTESITESESSSAVLNSTTYIINLLLSLGMTWWLDSSLSDF